MLNLVNKTIREELESITSEDINTTSSIEFLKTFILESIDRENSPYWLFSIKELYKSRMLLQRMTWHKYPKEKPDNKSRVVVDGEYAYGIYLFIDGYFETENDTLEEEEIYWRYV